MSYETQLSEQAKCMQQDTTKELRVEALLEENTRCSEAAVQVPGTFFSQLRQSVFPCEWRVLLLMRNRGQDISTSGKPGTTRKIRMFIRSHPHKKKKKNMQRTGNGGKFRF